MLRLVYNTILILFSLAPIMLKAQIFTLEKYNEKIISFDGRLVTFEDGQTKDLNINPSDRLIVLTRHGEKVDQTRDAELSEAGMERAEKLKDIFASAPVFDTVYASNYQRTINTIKPYCLSKDIAWQLYDPKMPELLISHFANLKKTLVSGHSNSIPILINMITGSSIQEFKEDEYSNLIFIKIPATGPKKIYIFQY